MHKETKFLKNSSLKYIELQSTLLSLQRNVRALKKTAVVTCAIPDSPLGRPSSVICAASRTKVWK